MSINREDVLKIAELAKLHFSESEADAFVPQFQSILDYIEQLKRVDVAGIEPTSHVSLTEDFEKYIFREDQTRPSLSPDEALSGAPDSGDQHFRVPKVIG
jgi:aspartyl-tRNA(Asn)/glutamyl-tRNA(Gln) amidotransferase subunit C